MSEDYFLRSQTYAAVAWMVSAGVLAAAWVTLLARPAAWEVAGMLAASGIFSASIAATLHIRSFHVRLCALVRATNGLGSSRPERVERAEVHPIR